MLTPCAQGACSLFSRNSIEIKNGLPDVSKPMFIKL